MLVRLELCMERDAWTYCVVIVESTAFYCSQNIRRHLYPRNLKFCLSGGSSCGTNCHYSKALFADFL